DRGVAVMLMDVDAFKELNDTLGHSSGDELLRQIGARLGPVLRDGEMLARLGGDEFGILVPELADAGEAEDAGRRLLDCLEEPFELAGLALDVRASVGIALFPDHGGAFGELMQDADVAMSLAKRD